jgi:hypothetical protein
MLAAAANKLTQFVYHSCKVVAVIEQWCQNVPHAAALSAHIDAAVGRPLQQPELQLQAAKMATRIALQSCFPHTTNTLVQS